MQGKIHKNKQWNEKSLIFTKMQSHNKNLIGLSKHSNSTFLTSSQDCTVRLWDLRTQSSTKLIRNKCLTEQLSNPQTDGNNSVYIASKSKLFLFDLRKQMIFIEQVWKEGSEAHSDNIDQIKYSEVYKQILCCDDQGDIRCYNSSTLEVVRKMQKQHINICNCVEYIYPQNKKFENMKVCISGGFDSTLIIWNIDEGKAMKKIALKQILQKYGVKGLSGTQYPFIHSIFSYGSSAIVGIESGHILCIPINEPRKPKFILYANLQRITDVIITNIMNRNILIASCIEGSFSLFDYQQRVNGEPKFMQKYGTIAQPIQVEFIGECIVVVCESPYLSFYQIKG